MRREITAFSLSTYPSNGRVKNENNNTLNDLVKKEKKKKGGLEKVHGKDKESYLCSKGELVLYNAKIRLDSLLRK